MSEFKRASDLLHAALTFVHKKPVDLYAAGIPGVEPSTIKKYLDGTRRMDETRTRHVVKTIFGEGVEQERQNELVAELLDVYYPIDLLAELDAGRKLKVGTANPGAVQFHL